MQGQASEGESTGKCKKEAYEIQALLARFSNFGRLGIKELFSVILLCFRKVFFIS
jgi:hypothetical protein